MRKAKFIQLPLVAAISVFSIVGVSSPAFANQNGQGQEAQDDSGQGQNQNQGQQQENRVASAARPVQLPPSICTGAEANRKERRRQYLEDLKNSVCENIDTTPNYQESALRYESPEASDCNFNLSLPGLPSFAGSGVDTCGMVHDVTGDLVDMGHQEMMDGVNSALGTIEDKTGLDAEDFGTDAVEIGQGVENATGLNNINDALETDPRDNQAPSQNNGSGFQSPDYNTGVGNPVGINPGAQNN